MTDLWLLWIQYFVFGFKKKSFCPTKIVLYGSNFKIFSNCFVLIATDVLLNIGQHSMQGSYIGPKSFKCCWINMAPNEIMGRAYMPLGIGLNNRETWIKFWTDRKKLVWLSSQFIDLFPSRYCEDQLCCSRISVFVRILTLPRLLTDY